MTGRAAGLILAAGLSTRFGSDKLSATLDGKAVLQHVIDAAVAARLAPLIVVVSDASRRVDWRGARPVVNRDPGRGLSSSLRLGLDELAADASVSRVVVLLGDQPRVSPMVIGRLLDSPAGPIVVPRYDDVAGNPVVLWRAAWPLAAGLTGDAGMRRVVAARPDLAGYVDVAGTNPDVDTPADLMALDAGSASGP